MRHRLVLPLAGVGAEINGIEVLRRLPCLGWTRGHQTRSWVVSSSNLRPFTRRPEDALSKVAEFFLAEVDLPDQHRANIVQHLVFSHTHVVQEAARFAETLRRYYYVTLKNYLDYIHSDHSQLSWNEKKVRLAAF